MLKEGLCTMNFYCLSFKTMNTIKLFLALLLFSSSIAMAQTASTFTNPLLPSGADPYSFYKNGYYYYTHTTGNRIILWKTKNLADLKNAEQKTIFTPPPGT